MTTGENENQDDAQHAENWGFKKDQENQVYDETDPTWPLVVVQWRDAHAGGSSSWTFTADYEAETCMPISTGWVWPKCKPGYLTLVSTVMNNPEDPDVVSDINHIPWENIVGVYSLAIHMPVNWNSELD